MPTREEKHRRIMAMAQVTAILGAGPSAFWRRCVFSMDTCATKQAHTLSSGAGPTHKIAPAPKPKCTCAKISALVMLGWAFDGPFRFCNFAEPVTTKSGVLPLHHGCDLLSDFVILLNR